MLKKIIHLLSLPYVFIYVALSMAKRSTQFPRVDFSNLMMANIFFVILTGFVIYFVHRSNQSENPHAFVRGVMGGMLAKMMMTALAFIVALPWVKKWGASEILLCMLIYLIYLMLEVRFLTKKEKRRMPKEKAPMEELGDYLPDGCLDYVLPFIYQHRIQLTVTRKRKSILGNYQYHPLQRSHRISINGNLNPYSFLITLLHEIAHLIAFDKYGGNVAPHGKEWKMEFANLLKPLTKKNLFPPDIDTALNKSLQNAAAGICGDPQLMRALRKYDASKTDWVTVEQLEDGATFKLEDGRKFIKGEKRRTRYKCQEIKTGKWYLFHGLYEVLP